MAAFVLGNGISRAHIEINDLMRMGDVYACNAVYRTHTPTVLVATDRPIATEIQESGYSSRNRFYTRRPLPNLGGLPVPRQYFGFSSGPLAAAIAAGDGHVLLYLLGFDLGPNQAGRFNNVFADTPYYKALGSAPTYTGNWIKQIATVARDHPNCRLVRVIGDTTAIVADLDNITNLSNLPMSEFEMLVNKAKEQG